MFKTIIENEAYTVASDYKKLDIKRDFYQSEAELEKSFIERLVNVNKYEYLTINSEDELILNLKKQIEKVNNVKFNEDEWNRFYTDVIKKPKDIVEKTFVVQKDSVHEFTFDDNTQKNIILFDKKDVFNNYLQVINQYEQIGKYKNRYDVTILVNGFPLVHIELKRRGVALKEAFNQIERYQRESFWSNSGLYEYVQIFVISNGTYTKYYSNSTRDILTNNEYSKHKLKSNAFCFTSYWADSKNNPIYSLEDFANTFLQKRNLLNIIYKYSVLTADNMLLVMRPYQIMATEKIIMKINIADNYKWYGSNKSGGYIWHTTGSGKTLTSFKTAQLCYNLDFVDKILFVVDRKDLDYQTVKEFENFSKGSVFSNKSTNVLKRQLEDLDEFGNFKEQKIIVTTIQKLNNFIKQNKTHPVYNKKVVMIFDECHRSQFGESHKNITKAFKKYFLFGFTGTPIFAENAQGTKLEKIGNLGTTEHLFGDRLHTYTIIDAIRDENVLPFLVDTVETFKSKDNIEDEDVYSINEESVLLSEERLRLNTLYMIKNWNIKTKNKRYNSILACRNIEMAKSYYKIFKELKEENKHNLKIAIIYSYVQNEDVDGYFTDDENFEDTTKLDISSKDFLQNAIDDYNILFKTNYSVDGDGFSDYYRDVSDKMKKTELDLLIVVNMFLTGFDAKRLNTLWVDKNLKFHGLLQAFSRTNRIYNNEKAYGNIVCFQNLESNIVDSLKLFGDDKNKGLIILESYDSYYNGFFDEKGVFHDGYKQLVEKLTTDFKKNEIPLKLEDKKRFVKEFNNLLRMVNLLSSFERFKDEKLINDYDFQEYMSTYIDIKNEIKEKIEEKEKEQVDILDDIVFETELIKQFEVNIDYILMILEKYKETKDEVFLVQIDKTIASSNNLKSKEELIHNFIQKINFGEFNIIEEWQKHCKEAANIELDNLIKKYRLKPETRVLFNEAFINHEFNLTTSVLDKIIPTMSFFGKTTTENKNKIREDLYSFYEEYSSLISSL